MNYRSFKKSELIDILERNYVYQSSKISCPKDIENEKIIVQLQKSKVEYFGIICLNSSNKIIKIHKLFRGTVNKISVFPAEVFKTALKDNAVSIMLFHNHPTGDLTPSDEDIRLTENIKNGGNIIGIKVLDHFIISFKGIKSLLEAGLFKHKKNSRDKSRHRRKHDNNEKQGFSTQNL